MSALPPIADIPWRNLNVRFGPKGDIAPLGRARADLVAERGSLRALRRHFVFDQADDGRDNRAGNTAAYCLAGKSTDVDVVAYSGHHRNERTKGSWPPPTPLVRMTILLRRTRKTLCLRATECLL